MKKIINGKMYNTETASLVGKHRHGYPSDHQYYAEYLYVKTSREYFIFGEGGPASKYSQSCGSNSWSGGESILPIDISTAKIWAEQYLAADDYVNIFGEVAE